MLAKSDPLCPLRFESGGVALSPVCPEGTIGIVINVTLRSSVVMPAKPWKAFHQIASSEITPESVWLNRRNLMKAAAVGGGLVVAGETVAETRSTLALDYSSAEDGTAFKAIEMLTPYEAATSYNNFYEFGTDKGDPCALCRHHDDRSLGD
jgi:hypothetical protein